MKLVFADTSDYGHIRLGCLLYFLDCLRLVDSLRDTEEDYSASMSEVLRDDVRVRAHEFVKSLLDWTRGWWSVIKCPAGVSPTSSISV
jgi:hypothetical protein